MKQDNKKYFLYGFFILLGLVLGYLLFSGSGFQEQSVVSGNSVVEVTASTPTQEGDMICSKVCLPRPRDCPRECPVGMHYECSGTIAMNCGCFPDLPIGGDIVTEEPICPDGQIFDTGRNTCITSVVA